MKIQHLRKTLLCKRIFLNESDIQGLFSANILIHLHVYPDEPK
jgi:hypothetical protein